MKTRRHGFMAVAAAGALALGASAVDLEWVYDTSARPAVENEQVPAVIAQPVETAWAPAEEASVWTRLFTIPLQGLLLLFK